MIKIFLKQTAAILILVISASMLPSCNNNNSSNSPSQAAVTITEDEAKALIKDLIPNAAIIYGSVFNGGTHFKVDESVTIPESENYALVVDDKIKSVADLKAWVEVVLTPEVAEVRFYSVYLKDLDLPFSSFDRNDYTPLYYDHEGKLYKDTSNGGHGFAFDWLYDTIKITELEDNAITAEIDRTLFDEYEETSIIKIVKRNDHWSIANDFIDHKDVNRN